MCSGRVAKPHKVFFAPRDRFHSSGCRPFLCRFLVCVVSAVFTRGPRRVLFGLCVKEIPNAAQYFLAGSTFNGDVLYPFGEESQFTADLGRP